MKLVVALLLANASALNLRTWSFADLASDALSLSVHQANMEAKMLANEKPGEAPKAALKEAEDKP